jgi:hypothetical protein
MKPSPPKVDLPSAGFIDFILAILKKRIFILFLLLGIVALALQFTVPGFSLAPVLALGFVFLGFIGSAFQAHRELALAYERAITPIPLEKNRRSGLSISFTPGSEYAYSIADPYTGQDTQINRMQNTRGMNCHFDARGIFFINGQVYYLMGKGGLDLNIQIINSGDVPLEITAIHVYDDLDLNHLRIYHDGTFLHGDRVRLPLRLAKGELLALQAKHKITLGLGSHDGLFAADFRALPRFILHEVAVEALDANGNRQIYSGEIKTSSQSLKDLYVKQWREYGQEEYLMLAGDALTGEGPTGDG